jgi:hypothetical protein
MSTTASAILVLALLCMLPGTTASTIPDPCPPTYRLHATSAPVPLLACPGTDAPSFIDQGRWIEVWVIGSGGPIANVPAFGTTWLCLPINIRSPDISGDLQVDLVDLSLFAASFWPLPYETCRDLNVDGFVDLIDLSVFAHHFRALRHECL